MTGLQLGDRPLSARAMVFDKDGVLLDFNHYWTHMTQLRIQYLYLLSNLPEIPGIAEALGLPDGVDPEGPLVMAGQAESSVIAASRLYSLGLSWVKARDIAREAFRLAEAEASYADLVLPTPRIQELFKTLVEKGWKIGIATTDTVKNAQSQLEYLGLASYVTAVLGADSVENGKPHPEMLWEACRQLGVPVSETVMVGDGPHDLAMGRNAGAVATIGVLSGVGTPESLENADLIVDCAGKLIDYLVS